MNVVRPPAPELPPRPPAPFHLKLIGVLGLIWCLALALVGGGLIQFSAAERLNSRVLEEVLDPTASEIPLLARAPVRMLWLHARLIGTGLIWFAVIEIVAIAAAYRMSRFALGAQILLSGGLVGLALAVAGVVATASSGVATVVALLGCLPPAALALSSAASYRLASTYSAVWPPIMVE